MNILSGSFMYGMRAKWCSNATNLSKSTGFFKQEHHPQLAGFELLEAPAISCRFIHWHSAIAIDIGFNVLQLKLTKATN